MGALRAVATTIFVGLPPFEASAGVTPYQSKKNSRMKTHTTRGAIAAVLILAFLAVGFLTIGVGTASAWGYGGYGGGYGYWGGCGGYYGGCRYPYYRPLYRTYYPYFYGYGYPYYGYGGCGGYGCR